VPQFFSLAYSEARTRFLEACRGRCATIHSYGYERRANDRVPDGLAIDTARFGPTNASRALVLISGTHGVEGFCGSACQVAFVVGESWNRLPTDTSVLLIHGLNPFGFAALRRVDAENIDLNRNFVRDFGTLAKYNLEYDQLNSALNPTRWLDTDPQDGDREIGGFIESQGMHKFQEVVSIGQYRHPKGLFFGGNEKAWSRLVLERIIETEFENTRSFCVIDYHTGLGPHGVGELISFDPEESDEYKRSVEWFGPEVKSTKSKAAAVKSVSHDVGGPVDKAFRCGDKTVTFVALEFGTVPVPVVLRALRAENWLHHFGKPESVLGKKIKEDLKSAFYSSDQTWQGMVLSRSMSVLQQAIAGLASP
jgi:hypothetical protein